MKNLIFLISITPILIGSDINNKIIQNQILEKDTLELIKNYNNRAEQYMSKDLDTAIDYANNALKLARNKNNDTLIVNSLVILGKSYVLKKSYRMAEKYLLNTLQIIKRGKNRTKIISSNLELGHIYFDLADYDKALKFYEEALRISIEINHEFWKAITLDAIGATFYATGNYDKALIKLKECLIIYKKLNDYKKIVRILYGHGAAYTVLSK